MTKRKIAVLGSGVGAMSTVFWLTNKPGWQDEYEITVHQMGWRFGGKGASGRGPSARIQEHGLHILLGFYENAFAMLRQTYGELAGEPGVFASFDDAFTGQNLIGMMDRYEGSYSPWLFEFPVNPGQAGDGSPQHYKTVWQLVVAAVKELGDWAEQLLAPQRPPPQKPHGLLEKIAEMVKEAGDHLLEDLGHLTEIGLLRMLHWFVERVPELGEQKPHHKMLLNKIIDHLLDDLRSHLENSGNTDVRRVVMVLDMGAAVMRGVIDNGEAINEHGLNTLDDLDFQEFLLKYGASQEAASVSSSAPVRALYDLSFAFEDGDPGKPNFAAGNALRAMFCLGMLYKGSVFHKMNAGMGDTIFAPFYKLLKKRGVKFEFFHQVQSMTLASDGGEQYVDTIEIARQATVSNGEYQPFVNIKGLDCWPQAPLVEQLDEGEALKKGPTGAGVDGWDGDWLGFDLENYWSGWKNAETQPLKRSIDFDDVILTIPPIAHRLICPQLVDAFPAWQIMVDTVGSVRTQAMQLWLTEDLAGLGWKDGSTVVDSFVDPFNTWADMSHLLGREEWPKGNVPSNIAYFCGPMPGGLPHSGPGDNPWPEAMSEVEDNAKQWLSSAPGWIWPRATVDGALKPDSLYTVAPGGTGIMRGQYWRANIFPSEFYVLSMKGTNDARLDAHELPCPNLYFAGDWTDSGFNGGCVEAAVISGMRASNALCGYPALADIQTYW